MRKENLNYLQHINTNQTLHLHKIRRIGAIAVTGLMLFGFYSCDK